MSMHHSHCLLCHLDDVDDRMGAFMLQQLLFRAEFVHQTLLFLFLLLPLLWSKGQVEGGKGSCEGGRQIEKVFWGMDMSGIVSRDIFKSSLLRKIIIFITGTLVEEVKGKT